MMLPKPGSKVLYEGKEHTLQDVAFRTPDGKHVTATEGQLHYKIKEVRAFATTEMWVDASGVTDPQADETFFDQDERSVDLQDIGYKMLSWREGLPDLPDNSKLPDIIGMLLELQYSKEGHYGSSWKGKGEYRGIMANMDRKYDRLDIMTQEEIKGTLRSLPEIEEALQLGKLDTVGESKVDAVADLTLYGLLYMTYIRDNFPLVFDFWVRRNLPNHL